LLTVTGSVVNIRSGPDTSYGVVKKVYSGDTLNASLLSSDNWYKVDLDGTAGWITGSYVSAVESTGAEGTGGRSDTTTGRGSTSEQDGASSGQNGDTTGQGSTANQGGAGSGQDGNVSRGGDPGRGTVTGSDSSGSAIQTGGTATDGSGSGTDSSANPDQNGASGRLVVIDAGHGGYDDGATGPSGTREKDITLSIALKLSELLRGAGYNTLMTRPDDTFISLPDRSLAANGSKADIFVSIHCNSSEYHTGRGTEVYTEPDRLNPVYKQQENSRYLAGLVQNELIKALGLTDRGIREKDLAVCRETNTPAILIETAFIDVKEEEVLLNDTSFQDKAAAAIKLGIDSYFSGK
jgi:N-acetylmuramoyl-L-alanine amidase